MEEAINSFEQIMLHFMPAVLVVPGIVLICVGLCLWLGGLRWRTPTAGFIGVVVGTVCVFFFSERQLAAYICIIVIGGFFGAFFEKGILNLTAGALVVFISLSIVAWGSFEADVAATYPSYEVPEDGYELVLTFKESVSAMKENMIFFADKLVFHIRNAGPKYIAISVGAAIAVVCFGIWIPRLVTGMTCAAIGTSFVFSGMVLLLLYKGAHPLSYVHSKGIFFGAVLGIMTMFGTVTELLLCPSRGKKAGLEERDFEG